MPEPCHNLSTGFFKMRPDKINLLAAHLAAHRDKMFPRYSVSDQKLPDTLGFFAINLSAISADRLFQQFVVTNTMSDPVT